MIELRYYNSQTVLNTALLGRRGILSVQNVLFRLVMLYVAKNSRLGQQDTANPRIDPQTYDDIG